MWNTFFTQGIDKASFLNFWKVYLTNMVLYVHVRVRILPLSRPCRLVLIGVINSLLHQSCPTNHHTHYRTHYSRRIETDSGSNK